MFSCEVCPGQLSMITYEKWIEHLLSLEHQLEQALKISRTSYWPQAEWTAVIRNIPRYDERGSRKLYTSLVMHLSQFGFIEAVYHGEKMNNSMLVAIQMFGQHERVALVSTVQDDEGKPYQITILPKSDPNGHKQDNARNSLIQFSPIMPTEEVDEYDHDKQESRNGTTTMTEAKVEVTPKPRITYSRDELLSFRDEIGVPQRFLDVLTFPKGIIKGVDTLAGNFDAMKLKDLREIKFETTDENEWTENNENRRFGQNNWRFNNPNRTNGNGKYNRINNQANGNGEHGNSNNFRHQQTGGFRYPYQQGQEDASKRDFYNYNQNTVKPPRFQRMEMERDGCRPLVECLEDVTPPQSPQA